MLTPAPSPPQLEEANTLLRAESEAAARLRKTQTESSKQLQQLEASVRELQDKCCLLERSKLSLEKECISLQAALETERREHSQGSETISDLTGGWPRTKLDNIDAITEYSEDCCDLVNLSEDLSGLLFCRTRVQPGGGGPSAETGPVQS